MSEQLEHRLLVLEQKLGVMMGEVNACLSEVETAMVGMAKGSKMALDVLQMQISRLRTDLEALASSQQTTTRTETEGKEL